MAPHLLPPERLAGQGLDPQQEESGNRAIWALLTDPEVCDQVDLVLTYRHGGPDPDAYEVWARRGLVRFRRCLEDDGSVGYEVLEVLGHNPLERQDSHALRTVAEERGAARASGHSGDDPARRFIAASEQSYPFGYERVAQLFDSPNAPDLAISPEDWSFGTQPGQHGALNVRQSRAPLWLAGSRVRPGHYDLGARAVDIAPTALAALDFPRIDGLDASGRSSTDRGVDPDVYLARQDGRVLEEILDFDEKPPERLYFFLLDGIHPTELEDRLESDPDALPNLRRLRRRAAVLRSGSIVNFPSITWPSHTAIATGVWCGHHDVVNPSYYLRDVGEPVSPQGQQLYTEGFASPGVESLYEAFRRVRGCRSFSVAIHAPFGRGADHAVLEGRNLGHRLRLKELTRELAVDESGRWAEDGAESTARESRLDTRGTAQILELLDRDDLPAPDFVYHELAVTDGAGHHYGPHSDGLRDALDETDRRIGRVLDALEERGLADGTLFVLTGDHGMAPQQVELRANPARHIEKIGLAGFVAEPMIWLRDLAVEAERAGDGRTARVRVRAHDGPLPGDSDAENGGLEGAEVSVSVVRSARGGSPDPLAHGRTGPGGVFGFATPAELDTSEIQIAVRAEGSNPRHLGLDGSVDGADTDLRGRLYG